mmetsp:Transcript_8944/g.16090  ORF Transcript_8944/g.16090 Transcript_8944/m.16090 type:complete len:246 (+) Transcript_8944:813-1550(+)
MEPPFSRSASISKSLLTVGVAIAPPLPLSRAKLFSSAFCRPGGRCVSLSICSSSSDKFFCSDFDLSTLQSPFSLTCSRAESSRSAPLTRLSSTLVSRCFSEATLLLGAPRRRASLSNKPHKRVGLFFNSGRDGPAERTDALKDPSAFLFSASLMASARCCARDLKCTISDESSCQLRYRWVSITTSSRESVQGLSLFACRLPDLATPCGPHTAATSSGTTALSPRTVSSFVPSPCACLPVSPCIS